MYRKLSIIFGLALFITILFVATATAEVQIFDQIQATVDIPEDYVIINTNNIDTYTTWLEAKGKTSEELTDDFEKRGVLLQAWSLEGDICIEFTAVKNENSRMIFDVNEQTSDIRGSYRVSHYPENDYTDSGYTYKSAQWKNMGKNFDRFLVMQYNHYNTNGENDYSGYARKTIRNGYEINIEIQVYGRSSSSKDNTILNKVWDTWEFTNILPLSNVASAQVQIKNEPSQETNSRDIVIDGYAKEGVEFIAVVMSLGSIDPDIINATAGKNDEFEIPISFPKQGVFLITLTASFNDEDIMEWAFPVTFSESMIPIEYNSIIPEKTEADELKIAGRTEPYTHIEILVNNEQPINKSANSDGRFALVIDTEAEGEYQIALVFSKKGLQNRRVVFEVKRQYSDEERQRKIKSEAIKPSYNNLVKKLEGYDGKIMEYTGYVSNIASNEDSWLFTFALKKSKDEYSDYLYIISDEQIEIPIDEKITMYGTCIGNAVSFNIGDETSNLEDYPFFKLLFFDVD